MLSLRAPGRAVGAVLVGAAFLAGCSAPPPAAEDLARDLFALANDERAAAGLAPVEWDECLAAKAAERVAPFAEDPDLEHAPLVSTCHEGAKAGENLSRTDVSASAVVALWMGSAGHRANILDGDFVSGAVACVDAASLPGGGDSGVRACSLLFEGATAG